MYEVENLQEVSYLVKCSLDKQFEEPYRSRLTSFTASMSSSGWVCCEVIERGWGKTLYNNFSYVKEHSLGHLDTLFNVKSKAKSLENLWIPSQALACLF